MKFNDKLSLLMHMQNIPNNKLAKALSVDPSLISRWRNGSRAMPKKSEYIRLIAQYITTHASDLQAIKEVLSIDCSLTPCESDLLADQLCHWLSDDYIPDLNLVNQFIERLNQSKAVKLPTFEQEHFKRYVSGKKLSTEAFIGTEGKRNAIIKFLDEVIRSPVQTTLLLYSDESMEWLTEDPEFNVLWAQMLVHTLKLGHRIKIIHTVNRNISELLSAIDSWLPLYMTGAIEPYYYPSYQESIFKRSLFIAPGISALTSNTVSDAEASEQFYHKDSQMISTLELEYDAYLKYCRPLMHIFTNANVDRFRLLLHEFENQKSDVAYVAHSPSLATVPSNVINAQLMRAQLSPQSIHDMLTFYNTRKKTFDENLMNHKHFEWLNLPDPRIFTSLDYQPKSNLDWFHGVSLNLTKTEYIEHIENLIHLLKTQKQFHLHLLKTKLSNDTLIIVKKEIGVIVCKVHEHPVYFALNHPAMINAFQTFIEGISDCKQSETPNKMHIIGQLEHWVTRVQKHSKIP